MFGSLNESINTFFDACTKVDATIALGIASRVEELMKETENTAYLWLHQLLSKLLDRSLARYTNCVSEQVKIIKETTKVSKSKRSGVLPMFKTLPLFLDKMESVLNPLLSKEIYST